MSTSAFPVAVAAVLALSAAGPVATAGATTTREKPFSRPPYYQGPPPGAGAGAVHVAPIASVGGEMPDTWIPRGALEHLARDIDAFLVADGLSLGPLDVSPRGAPAVSFGCAMDAIGECDAGSRQNVLATTSGTRDWRERAAHAMRGRDADHLLVLEVRLAPQWIHQRNLTGKKEVRLGTGRAQPVPWLTSLASPVWVIQITGALVDGEGKVVRSGAEGLYAVRTPFRASMLHAERLMTDSEVEAVRRDPLWQTAVRDLVRSLIKPETGW